MKLGQHIWPYRAGFILCFLLALTFTLTLTQEVDDTEDDLEEEGEIYEEDLEQPEEIKGREDLADRIKEDLVEIYNNDKSSVNKGIADSTTKVTKLIRYDQYLQGDFNENQEEWDEKILNRWYNMTGGQLDLIEEDDVDQQCLRLLNYRNFVRWFYQERAGEYPVRQYLQSVELGSGGLALSYQVQELKADVLEQVYKADVTSADDIEMLLFLHSRLNQVMMKLREWETDDHQFSPDVILNVQTMVLTGRYLMEFSCYDMLRTQLIKFMTRLKHEDEKFHDILEVSGNAAREGAADPDPHAKVIRQLTSLIFLEKMKLFRGKLHPATAIEVAKLIVELEKLKGMVDDMQSKTSQRLQKTLETFAQNQLYQLFTTITSADYKARIIEAQEFGSKNFGDNNVDKEKKSPMKFIYRF